MNEDLCKEIEQLKKALIQKDNTIRLGQQEYENSLALIRQEYLKEQEKLKQDLLSYMLKKNSVNQQMNQLQINYEILLKAHEDVIIDRDSKLKTILDIIEKKDFEIQELKKVINSQSNLKYKENNTFSKDREYYEQKIQQLEISKEQMKYQEEDLRFKVQDLLEANELLQHKLQENNQQLLLHSNEHLVKYQEKQQDNIEKIKIEYDIQLQEQKALNKQQQQNLDQQVQIIQKLNKQKEQMQNDIKNQNTQLQRLSQELENVRSQQNSNQFSNQKLEKDVDKYAKIFRNQELEIKALQTQLQQSADVYESTRQKDLHIQQLSISNQDLQQQNEYLREAVETLKQTIDSIQQSFEQNLDLHRKSTNDLLNREQELLLIIESLKNNINDSEFQVNQKYQKLYQDYINIQQAYNNIIIKDRDIQFRMKLVKEQCRTQKSTERQQKIQNLENTQVKKPIDRTYSHVDLGSFNKLQRNVYLDI
ncbi:hypothetical protein pb186bvf_003259 [Paramecium bursaria]